MIPIENNSTIPEAEDSKTILFDSLEIRGYRCFDHLNIERLGRVNLIVGKNNVGKTALLEALWIYSRRGNIRTLIDLLFSRDEVPLYIEQASPLEIKDVRVQKEELQAEIGNLFHNRPTLDVNSRELISVKSSDSSLSVQTTRLVDPDGNPTADFSLFENIWRDRPLGLIIISSLKEHGNEEKRSEFFSLESLRSFLLEPAPDSIPSTLIRSKVSDNDTLAKSWDEALKNGLEERVKHFLQIIEPEIENINFVGTGNASSIRHPIASRGFSSKRVSLKSFGEGMTRLLALSLAFVKSINGIILIDEIESGIHFSVLPDIWKLIFRTAKELNVQVFATTHSYDCVEAFSKAAIEDEESEGMLIRLARHEDQIKAFTFDEKQLETISKERIEVR